MIRYIIPDTRSARPMAAALQGGAMPGALGYHLVKSGYGLWLPGDERGHWSDAWDEQIGYTHNRTHSTPATRYVNAWRRSA